MEAGNRCYDDRTPEEVNRRLIDHVSSVLLPYTERARQNLLAEGIHSSRIFVTGNPIHEVIEHYGRQIDLAAALARERLGIKSQGYFLVTLHREENVGDRERLKSFLAAFAALNNDYSFPVIVSTHPRTRKRLEDLRHIRNLCGDTRFLDPFGFFDFIALQRSAFCVLSDSGTVQEESCLLGVPSVTLRDTTERPETVEAGASVLSSADPVRIVALVNQVTSVPDGRTKKWTPSWTVPAEYLRLNVAETVVRILTSHCQEATR
jgi:UDP-N-acetylglucosamine 2-epimerase (non-hydrolysing)